MILSLGQSMLSMFQGVTTMSDGREDILAILEDLYLNVLEDVPDNYYTKHLQCSLEDAKEILIEAGVLEDDN